MEREIQTDRQREREREGEREKERERERILTSVDRGRVLSDELDAFECLEAPHADGVVIRSYSQRRGQGRNKNSREKGM